MTMSPWMARGKFVKYHEEDAEQAPTWLGLDDVPDFYAVMLRIDTALCTNVTLRRGEYLLTWMEKFNDMYDIGAPLAYLALNGWVLKTDEDGMDYLVQYAVVVETLFEAWNNGQTLETANEMVDAALAEYFLQS